MRENSIPSKRKQAVIFFNDAKWRKIHASPYNLSEQLSGPRIRKPSPPCPSKPPPGRRTKNTDEEFWEARRDKIRKQLG
ncbi:hypothetical protein E2C01_093269 [Portunus trituberculatus]|uniref:Uncharacterized protein n=1 Tax=Portunus trituberculatus TaxID=210409 RepID=A0A5B7K021_PORTR|nr:hypothetical protein [Portunus trituberculatus]